MTYAKVYVGTGTGTLAQFDYTHDAAGNRRLSTEQFDTDTNGTLDHSQTFTYDYDALNRLRTEIHDAPGTADDYVHHYAFDANTNRKSWKKDNGSTNPFTTTYDEEVTYTHDANDRLLTEASTTNGNTTYEFGPNADHPNDYAGDHTNQTKKTTINGGTTETHTYTYNEMGRLSGVTITKTGQPTTSETYTYNTNGLRVTTTANGTTTTYLFDTTNPTGYAQVLEETVGSTLTKTYTLGLDVIAQATTGQLLTLLYDTHGSTRALLDTAASVVINNVNGTNHTQLFSYDVYGNSLGFDPTASLTTLLYSGEWTDSGGTQWLRGRDQYQISTGRFSQVDPFVGDTKIPQTIHEYGYVHGNPVGMIDPSGRFGIYATGLFILGPQSIGGVGRILLSQAALAASAAVAAHVAIMTTSLSSSLYRLSAELQSVDPPLADGMRIAASAVQAVLVRTIGITAINSILTTIGLVHPRANTAAFALTAGNLYLTVRSIAWIVGVIAQGFKFRQGNSYVDFSGGVASGTAWGAAQTLAHLASRPKDPSRFVDSLTGFTRAFVNKDPFSAFNHFVDAGTRLQHYGTFQLQFGTHGVRQVLWGHATLTYTARAVAVSSPGSFTVNLNAPIQLLL